MITSRDIFYSLAGRCSEVTKQRGVITSCTVDIPFPSRWTMVVNHYGDPTNHSRIEHFQRIRIQIGDELLIVAKASQRTIRRFYFIRRPSETAMVEFILRMGDDLIRYSDLD